MHVVGIKTADWLNILITEGPETHTIQNVHDIQNYLAYKEPHRKRQSTDASVKMTYPVFRLHEIANGLL